MVAFVTRALVWLTFVFSLLGSSAWASLRVGDRMDSGDLAFEVQGLEVCAEGASPFFRSGLQCRQRDALELGLNALSLSLGLTASLCGVVGGPVTVGLGVAASLTALATFTVSRIPCEDPDEEARFRHAVCDVLDAQGFGCNPESLPLDRKELP